MDSDSDFEPDSNTLNRNANKLRMALRKARLSLNDRGRACALAQELGQRFASSSSRNTPLPVAPSRRTKKKKLLPWKVVTCCLEGPESNKVPTRGTLDRLCKRGLGILWFTKEGPLELPTYLTADELHFLVVCLYPLLQRIPYEFCKAAGPGNNVIVPLNIEDQRMKPSASRPLAPYFTPDMLKACIGRKGKLYIRPLRIIDLSAIPARPEHEVSAFQALFIRCISIYVMYGRFTLPNRK